MANVIEPKVMKDHQRPILVSQLAIDMASHIIVDFRKVLLVSASSLTRVERSIQRQRSSMFHHDDRKIPGKASAMYRHHT